MKILLASSHRYPALRGASAGREPIGSPSSGCAAVHDWLAKGLGEAGHEVFYRLRGGAGATLPRGVRLARPGDTLYADIAHNEEAGTRPCVVTCHGLWKTAGAVPDNWIFVSQTLAALFGRTRAVPNGIDPAEYVYSETKSAYVLFLSSAARYLDKGLDIALSLSRKMGFELVVAGSGCDAETIGLVAALCRAAGARYVGDIRGAHKAELLAGARALLFPTRVPEGFGLVLAEALMSGTPVVCSANGACGEIVTPDVGFVCRDESDYVRALDEVRSIDPRACRERAMREYDYRIMTERYVREYERELGRAHE